MNAKAGQDAAILVAEAIRGRPIPPELRVHAGDVIVGFNGAPGRTHGEVLAVVDAAMWRVYVALAKPA